MKAPGFWYVIIINHPQYSNIDSHTFQQVPGFTLPHIMPISRQNTLFALSKLPARSATKSEQHNICIVIISFKYLVQKRNDPMKLHRVMGHHLGLFSRYLKYTLVVFQFINDYCILRKYGLIFILYHLSLVIFAGLYPKPGPSFTSSWTQIGLTSLTSGSFLHPR